MATGFAGAAVVQGPSLEISLQCPTIKTNWFKNDIGNCKIPSTHCPNSPLAHYFFLQMKQAELGPQVGNHWFIINSNYASNFW